MSAAQHLVGGAREVPPDPLGAQQDDLLGSSRRGELLEHAELVGGAGDDDRAVLLHLETRLAPQEQPLLPGRERVLERPAGLGRRADVAEVADARADGALVALDDDDAEAGADGVPGVREADDPGPDDHQVRAAFHHEPRVCCAADAFEADSQDCSRTVRLPVTGSGLDELGVNVIAAGTDDEARVLATSQQMTFADMFRGMPSLLKPPVDDIEAYWTPREKAQTEQMLSCSVVGSAETVREGLNHLVADTKADELMIVTDIFDFSQRVRSLEITARAAT